MGKVQPTSVSATAILNTLIASALFYLVYIALSSSTDILHDSSYMILSAVSGGYGSLLLVDAFLIFRGMRVGWYLTIILYFILLLCLSVFYYNLFLPVLRGTATMAGGIYGVSFITFMTCSLLAPITIISYFLRKGTRSYFNTRDDVS